jgi:hypothetical protein
MARTSALALRDSTSAILLHQPAPKKSHQPPNPPNLLPYVNHSTPVGRHACRHFMDSACGFMLSGPGTSEKGTRLPPHSPGHPQEHRLPVHGITTLAAICFQHYFFGPLKVFNLSTRWQICQFSHGNLNFFHHSLLRRPAVDGGMTRRLWTSIVPAIQLCWIQSGQRRPSFRHSRRVCALRGWQHD